MDKNIIIAIVLGILVLVSIVQAIQLNELKTKLSEGSLTLSKAGSATSTSSGAGVPSNIQDLPSMVGGC